MSLTQRTGPPLSALIALRCHCCFVRTYCHTTQHNSTVRSYQCIEAHWSYSPNAFMRVASMHCDWLLTNHHCCYGVWCGVQCCSAVIAATHWQSLVLHVVVIEVSQQNQLVTNKRSIARARVTINTTAALLSLVTAVRSIWFIIRTINRISVTIITFILSFSHTVSDAWRCVAWGRAVHFIVCSLIIDHRSQWTHFWPMNAIWINTPMHSFLINTSSSSSFDLVVASLIIHIIACREPLQMGGLLADEASTTITTTTPLHCSAHCCYCLRYLCFYQI